MSSRFSESLGKTCLKCIYYKEDIRESLLYRMLHQPVKFDYFVVVGGFCYDQLEKVIQNDFSDMADRIILVENSHYSDYGSGYSLYLGLEAIKGIDYDEVVFAEGDLYVDEKSFRKVCESPKNVVTCSHEAILASKAVAFYYDTAHRLHYIYDTSHSALEIKEPFLGIFNSGQIWKFADAGRLRRAAASLSPEQWQTTNLVLVQAYFGELDGDAYEIIAFEKWINCNTVADYEKIED